MKTTDTSLLLESCINDCDAEVADSRLVRHAINCVEKGYKKVAVRTVDTDVLVLLLSYSPHMNKIGESEAHALMGKTKNILDL